MKCLNFNFVCTLVNKIGRVGKLFLNRNRRSTKLNTIMKPLLHDTVDIMHQRSPTFFDSRHPLSFSKHPEVPYTQLWFFLAVHKFN